MRYSACPTAGYITLRAWPLPTDYYATHLRLWPSAGSRKYLRSFIRSILPFSSPSMSLDFTLSKRKILSPYKLYRIFVSSRIEIKTTSKLRRISMEKYVVAILGIESARCHLQSSKGRRHLCEPVEERSSRRRRNSSTTSGRKDIPAVPFSLLQTGRSLPTPNLQSFLR